MTILITGAAGFVGSNLVSRFLSIGERVIGIDNFSRGSRSHLNTQILNSNFVFKELDLTRYIDYRNAVEYYGDSITEVWHLAANSDIPAGIVDPTVDLKDTFMTTFNTLNVMREFNIKTLVFASSSAIYGDHQDVMLHENMGPLFPISNYGAMKLSSEAIIGAALESYLNCAYIFRFPNVIGVPATHGVLFDFFEKLKRDPVCLKVLGDGSQKKCYLHVSDLIDAMFFIRKNANERLNFFNIGAGDEGITVRSIAELAVRTFAPGAIIKYGIGNKGWVGDIPKFKYSTDKLSQLGWKPNLNSEEAILLTIKEMYLG
jgi:UDP-glucose 4-epimerase